MYFTRYFIALGFNLISTEALAIASSVPHSVISRGELMRVLTGLLIVVLIIVSLSWIIKRLNVVHLGSSKGFESIASMTLGPKEKVMLLRIGTRYLLIGVGASAVSTLCDFGEQLPDGFDNESKPSFAAILKSVARNS